MRRVREKLRVPGSPPIPIAYPRAPAHTSQGPATLRDGTALSLRLMTPSVAHSMVAFARSLAEEDLMFAPRDITGTIVVMLWGQDIRAGLTVTVLAEKENEVGG